MHSQEIELKLRVVDKADLLKRLVALGASFVSARDQIDILFESVHHDFDGKDQALRLRREVMEGKERATLTFKGTPSHTAEGHKVRDEFETVVKDPQALERILTSLEFIPALRIQKHRESYRLDGVSIEIDTLPFGVFVELEGSSAAIEQVREKLDLQSHTPVTEGYHTLQRAWDKNIE